MKDFYANDMRFGPVFDEPEGDGGSGEAPPPGGDDDDDSDDDDD